MAEKTDTATKEADNSKPIASPQSNEVDDGIRAIAQRPLYCTPGQPPIPPGTEIMVCPITARAWLRSGIIRLAKGEKMPISVSSQSNSPFPVFAKAAPPPPVSGG